MIRLVIYLIVVIGFISFMFKLIARTIWLIVEYINLIKTALYGD